LHFGFFLVHYVECCGGGTIEETGQKWGEKKKRTADKEREGTKTTLLFSGWWSDWIFAQNSLLD
jgi:hypothetical protein